MTETTHIGMSLATSLQRQLDMTANNIANASTAGYKGEHMVFESLVQKGTPAGEDAANFVSDTGSYIDTRPGAMSQTGNPLDVALLGSLEEQGFTKFDVLDIDEVNVGAYMRNTLRIDWSERCRTPVQTTDKVEGGFGSRLLNLMIERQLEGSYERDLRPDGLHFVIEIPWSAAPTPVLEPQD